VISSISKNQIRRLNKGNLENDEISSLGRSPQEILEDFFGFCDFPPDIKIALKESETNSDSKVFLQQVNELIRNQA
jgi:hypothetical protein